MAKDILMPQMGYDMTEGTLVRWVKKVGDKVNRGDIVAEIETDKATVEIEAFDSGTLLRTVAEPGDTVPVGEPIATLGAAGEALPEPVPRAAATPAADAPPPPAEPEPARGKHPPGPSHRHPRPRSRRRRRTRRRATAPTRRPWPAGSPTSWASTWVGPRAPGPAGASPPPTSRPPMPRLRPPPPPGRHPLRRQRGDRSADHPRPPARAAAPPLPEGAEDIEPSRLRQTIARRMAESKRTAPHFYVSVDIRAGALLAARKKLVDAGKKVSVNDLLVRAMALATVEHPQVNTAYIEGKVRHFQRIDVGMAVATDNGLLSPAILDVANKDVETIGAEARDLVERARAGKLKPAEYGGGTITLSNLGMFGIDQFLAILNPPQALIVSVGAAADRVVAVKGKPAVDKVMTAWAAADHRVLDGADVAQFLATLRELLEDPTRLTA